MFCVLGDFSLLRSCEFCIFCRKIN